MEHHHNHDSLGKFVAFVAGAATAAAAGMYLFSGREGTRRRHKLNSWISNAKSEILEKIKDTAELTEKEFETIVDKVMKKYEKMEDVGREKLEKVSSNFKRRFEEMRMAAEEAKEEAEKEMEKDEDEDE